MRVFRRLIVTALVWLALTPLATPGVLAAGNLPAFATRADVQAFIVDMTARHGFDEAALDTLFSRIHPVPAVISAITPPTEPGARSWKIYRDRFVESRRIAAGTRFWRDNATALRRASARYDIPEEIIVAIIGIETIYGRNTGKFGTLAALATLAFDYPPRAALFRGELEALLLLARTEKRDPLSYRGSFAGAMGLPQFLPSSVRQWGVDFDGNAIIDLATAADAIGSVATFLYAHGWQPGEPVATAATLAAGSNPQALIDEGIRPVRLPAEMAAMGIRAEQTLERPAALIDLASPDAPTEYWLGYQNFFVITRYNRSSFYAMAVYQLAGALRAAHGHEVLTPSDSTRAKHRAR